MKLKAGLLCLVLFLLGTFPASGQTVLGQAAGDFFSAFASMVGNENSFTALND